MPILVSLAAGVATIRAEAAPASKPLHQSVIEVSLPPEWTQCARDTDCVLIPIGCDGAPAAANRSRAAAAEKALYARFGDPRAMDCSISKERRVYRPECRQKRCQAISGK